jgi:hypothetical protein
VVGVAARWEESGSRRIMPPGFGWVCQGYFGLFTCLVKEKTRKINKMRENNGKPQIKRFFYPYGYILEGMRIEY